MENQIDELQDEMNKYQTNGKQNSNSNDMFNSSMGESIELDEILELKRKLHEREEELRQLKTIQIQRNDGQHKVCCVSLKKILLFAKVSIK